VTRKTAALRVCASCEWVFAAGEDADDEDMEEGAKVGCPKCQFGSYSAHSVYGARCYRYAITQAPWVQRKLATCQMALAQEVRESPAARRAHVSKTERGRWRIATSVVSLT